MPYASVGSGPLVVGLPGLAPVAGVANDSLVRSVISPLAGLAGSRRIIVLNRRERLAEGMSMAQLAAEHAEALQTLGESPVDLVGTSTGGRIAQQLADLPTVAAPTRIVASERDRFYPRALFEETARLIPRAQRRVVRRRGHITVLNDRRARATITGFLLAPSPT